MPFAVCGHLMYRFEPGACEICGLCDLAPMPCDCDVCWRCITDTQCPGCQVKIRVDFEWGEIELDNLIEFPL